MLFYIAWISLSVAYYILIALFSVKYNDNGGYWGWLIYLLPMVCPLWVIVAKYSKHLMFDNLLFDAIATAVCALAILKFSGSLSSTAWFQWVGIGLIMIGLVLIKLK